MNYKNKRKIVFYPDAGLGNRLNCLYSAFSHRSTVSTQT